MNSAFKRALCLRSVVTVSEAAYMYGVSTRRMAVWCEDGNVQSRKTQGGAYLISLDDLIVRRGDPKRWPDGLMREEYDNDH